MADAKDGDSQSGNKKRDAFEKATLATAVCGVVILTVYTILTGYQAYVARDTEQRDLRAWIRPKGAFLAEAPQIGEPITYQIAMENFGREPARDVGIANEDFFLDVSRFPDEIHHPDAWASAIGENNTCQAINFYNNRVVFPGQTGTSVLPTGKPPVNEQVMAGTMAIVVRGCWRYESAEGPSKTGYCFFFLRRGNTVLQAGTEGVTCPIGNFAE